MDDLTQLNKTELINIIKAQTGRRVSRTLSTEELIDMISNGNYSRFAKTEQSRVRLELFIEKNWDFYQTNLPCRGQFNEGKCTKFKCPESRHINCFLNVKDQLIKEGL